MSLELEQMMKQALDGTFIQWAVQAQCFIARKVPKDFNGDYSQMKICHMQGTSNPSRKWTDEDIQMLLSLRGAGVGFDLVARQMNRTVAACRVKYSEETRDPNQKRRSFGAPWNDADSAMLRKLAAHGLSAVEIAEKMKRSPDTVRKWAKDMGVKVRRLRKMQLRYLKKAA